MKFVELKNVEVGQVVGFSGGLRYSKVKVLAQLENGKTMIEKEGGVIFDWDSNYRVAIL